MLLTLQQVSKTYDREGFSLKPLNLEIQPSEFFCLLGPSGCGKTTVLRLIAGLEKPDSGKIILQDKDITPLSPNQRNLHTVFQRYALFPHLSVFENIAFSLRIKKIRQNEITNRVDEMLKLLEIEALKDRKPSQLSGGQQQRVAVARSLINKPSLLLLDEPLSALDPALRFKVREELKMLCKKIGITFVMVTHDQEEALLLSDRMAVFKDGHCLQVGTPKDIYEYPANDFVARFIGPVNEIKGELVEESSEIEKYTFQSTHGVFKLKKNGVAYPKEILLILRPEKLKILRHRSTAQENLIEAEVEQLSYLGSRTEYLVKTQKNQFKVFEAELDRMRKKSLNPGDKIYLGWRSEDAIILPPETFIH